MCMSVQLTDTGGVRRARNTIPSVDARIAIEPVGVALPLGTIGGTVKIHESLTCASIVLSLGPTSYQTTQPSNC